MGKPALKVVVGAATLAFVLCGCAGQRYRPATWYSEADVDIGKIATVNEWAEQRGAKVMWIHYPVKNKDADKGTSE